MLRNEQLNRFAFAACIIIILSNVSGFSRPNTELIHDSQVNIPHLRKQGTATQLIVDDKPFLILGGELHNSSASSLGYLDSLWRRLIGLNINTVLAPVYWELIEPREGEFDFTLVDGLIEEAGAYELRLVLLWFGSWKNSMSCYVPEWVKTDQQRFPRARVKNGRAKEILSAFSSANRDADARAFTALMKHIRRVDGKSHTVIMVQVENEIGMLKDARDYSDAANEAFEQQVPNELVEYLTEHKETLIPEFREVWAAGGYKTSGSWQEVFGKGLATDEIFMAWHYGRYVNYVAEAGKAEYPLPMFVNAALIRPNYKPGQYPSAGPLPHLMDIWRAAAPQIEFLSPDIYFPNFAEWCQKYHRSGNPLFIPEAKAGSEGAVNVFYAVGQHDAMGFSPFGIDSIAEPENSPISKSYEILSRLTPLILEKQGGDMMAGVVLSEQNQSRRINLGQYILNVSHDYIFKWASRPTGDGPWPLVGGIIISTGPDEYVIAGSGIIITFASQEAPEETAGIVSIREGKYEDGRWVGERRLNGDASHQGRHLRLPYGDFGIQRVRLYRYN